MIRRRGRAARALGLFSSCRVGLRGVCVRGGAEEPDEEGDEEEKGNEVGFEE